jgi:hypothetical protein
MSRQQTIYTQAKVSNNINIVNNNNNDKSPISEIELERNEIDDKYASIEIANKQ